MSPTHGTSPPGRDAREGALLVGPKPGSFENRFQQMTTSDAACCASRENIFRIPPFVTQDCGRTSKACFAVCKAKGAPEGLLVWLHGDQEAKQQDMQSRPQTGKRGLRCRKTYLLTFAS